MDITLPVGGLYPDGTSVDVYEADTQVWQGRMGVRALTGVVVASQQVTFTGLVDEETYFMVGAVNGEDRVKQFVCGADSPPSGGRLLRETDLEGILDEVGGVTQAEVDAAIAAHTGDTVDAHDASAVSYAGGTGMSATDVEAAIDELATEKQDAATAATDAELATVSTAISDHIADATAAHAAAAISYAGGTGMSATDVEAAIDELATEKQDAATAATDTELNDHITDATAAHAASAISYAGGQGIAATTVEGAIDELATVPKVNESVGRDINLTDMNACITVNANSQTFTIPDPVISGVLNGSWFEVMCDTTGPTTVTHAGGAKIFDPFTGSAVTSVVIPATAPGKFARYRFTNYSLGSNQWIVSHDNQVPNSLIDAKGDLIAGTAADTPGRLAVGTNYYQLIADSAVAAGMKWVKGAFYNVEHYGAVSGGSASTNRTAIQAALDAVGSTNGCVVIPDGTFAIDGLLDIPGKTSLMLIGDLDLTSAASCVLQLGDGTSQRLDQTVFGGGSIYCNRNATDAIMMDCCRNADLRNIVIYDPTNSAITVQNTNAGTAQLDCDTHVFDSITLKSEPGVYPGIQRPARMFVFDGSDTYLVTDCQIDNCVALGGLLPTSFTGASTDDQDGGIGLEIYNADRITANDFRVYSHVQRAVGGASLGAATVTIANPAVVTRVAHGLAANDPIYFTTTGALPTGMNPEVIYFVRATNLTANTFEFSATAGGAAIATSGSQSGTHTLFDGGSYAANTGAVWIHADGGNTANGNTIKNLYCEADPSTGTTNTDWNFFLVKIQAGSTGTCDENHVEKANISCSAAAANKRFWWLVNGGTSVKYNYFTLPKIVTGHINQLNVGSGCTFNRTELLTPTETWTNAGGVTNAFVPMTVSNPVSLINRFDDVGNVGTGTDTLYTNQIPAGRLAENGDWLRVRYGLLITLHASQTRLIRVSFGGTVVFTQDAAWTNTGANQTMVIDLEIVRVSSSVVRCTATGVRAPTAGGDVQYCQYTEVTGLTLANAQTLLLDGAVSAGADNQIVAKQGTVTFFPAA